MIKFIKKHPVGCIVGVVLYLFFCFYVVHFIWVLQDGEAMEDAFLSALLEVLTRPFDIFPIPPLSLFVIGLVTALVPFFLWVQKKNLEYRKTNDPKDLHGSAGWMKGKELEDFQCAFSEPFGKPENKSFDNVIISDQIAISMSENCPIDNLNNLIIGGSGAGKSFRYVIPNILQAKGSYIINDPNGANLKGYGKFLEARGYRIKVFNLVQMDNSNHYNPFNYIETNDDVQTLVTTLLENTKKKDSKGGDQFWDDTMNLLLCALVSFQHSYCRKEEQNFSHLMSIVRMNNVNEENSDAETQVDKLFNIKTADGKFMVDRNSFCYKQYEEFRQAAGKTMKSILISLSSRLSKFDIPKVIDLTSSDDIGLDYVGDEPTAIFVILPVQDRTYDFLASMMYSQLFQRLYTYCETSAQYGQLVRYSNGEVLRTFRAKSADESALARKKAEEFLKRIQSVDAEKAIAYNEKRGFYEIRTEKGELVTYRDTKEHAEKALASLKNGEVIANKDTGRLKGQYLPIHLRMILDEFANTGRIPSFQEIVATIRKYSMSVNIIIQSVQQMKDLYKEQWESIASNCAVVLYLGGGTDTVTGEWLQKLIGKETKWGLSMSFQGKSGGSETKGAFGEELYPIANGRRMDKNECVILTAHQREYKGRKYNTLSHPNWKEAQSIGSYSFLIAKAEDLAKELDQLKTTEEDDGEKHQGPIQETKKRSEQENKDSIAQAVEAKKNQDLLGNDIITSPQVPSEDDSDPVTDVVDKKDVDKASDYLSTNDDEFALNDFISQE